MISFYSHAARIVAQLEALLCRGDVMQPCELVTHGDAVAVHSHTTSRHAPSPGDARLRSVVVPGRWMVMVARGEGLAIKRNGSAAFVDVVTPCEDHLIILPGRSCPVQSLAGGSGVRCWWEHGRGDWHALHVHVGLDHEQSAAESVLMECLRGSCIVGARMRGRWTWQDKCSEEGHIDQSALQAALR